MVMPKHHGRHPSISLIITVITTMEKIMCKHELFNLNNLTKFPLLLDTCTLLKDSTSTRKNTKEEVWSHFSSSSRLG
jgi:hypothetical protein